MGDEGEFWKAVKDDRMERRKKYGLPCPMCVAQFPRAQPKILLPGGFCKRHGYKDTRERIND